MPKSKLPLTHRDRVKKRIKSTEIELNTRKKSLTKKLSEFMDNYRESKSEDYIASRKEAIEVTESVKSLSEELGWDEAEKKVEQDIGKEKMNRVREFILKEKLKNVN